MDPWLQRFIHDWSGQFLPTRKHATFDSIEYQDDPERITTGLNKFHVIDEGM
jgi:hypothetical protein